MKNEFRVFSLERTAKYSSNYENSKTLEHLHSKEAPQVTPQVAPQDDIQTKCNELVLFCRIPRSKKEMMAFLKLSDRKSFEKLYIKPLLNKRIRYTVPDKPNSRIQKYVAIGES